MAKRKSKSVRDEGPELACIAGLKLLLEAVNSNSCLAGALVVGRAGFVLPAEESAQLSFEEVVGRVRDCRVWDDGDGCRPWLGWQDMWELTVVVGWKRGPIGRLVCEETVREARENWPNNGVGLGSVMLGVNPRAVRLKGLEDRGWRADKVTGKVKPGRLTEESRHSGLTFLGALGKARGRVRPMWSREHGHGLVNNRVWSGWEASLDRCVCKPGGWVGRLEAGDPHFLRGWVSGLERVNKFFERQEWYARTSAAPPRWARTAVE